MTSSTSSASPPVGRREARKQRTRAALLAATQQLVADGGHEAVTIEAVTAAADIGFGTFYGYFDSKDDLLAAAVADISAGLGALNDALTTALDDPAEVMSASIRHTIGSLEVAPRWARFVTGLGFAEVGVLTEQLTERLRRDLAAGQRSGRFLPDPDGRHPYVIHGAVLAAIRARVDGHLPPGSATDVAADVLRLLGLPSAEADAIARRPLPALHLPIPEGP